MDRKVGIGMIGHARHSRIRRVLGARQRWRMAQRASYRYERRLAPNLGCGCRGRSRRSRQPHKRCEIDGVGRHLRCRAGRARRIVRIQNIRGILRRRVVNAARNRGALIREYFIRYALLHVVGLARENQQGLVLRLPPESGDRSVVSAGVQSPADPQLAFLRLIHRQVRLQDGVRSVLYQPKTERWSRNGVENHIMIGELESRKSWYCAISQPFASDRPLIVNNP